MEIFKNLNWSKVFKKDSFSLSLDFNYEKEIKIEAINYQKPEGNISNILLNLKKTNKHLNVNKVKINDGANSILIKGLKFKKTKIFNCRKKISVKTFKDGSKNNDFLISFFGYKILIKGVKFDATNLPHLLNR